MAVNDSLIEKALLDGNYIVEKDLKEAEAISKQRGVSILDYLLSEELISRRIIGEAIAESLGTRFIDLSTLKLTPELIKLVPAKFATKYRTVAVKQLEDGVILTTDDPKSAELIKAIPQFIPNTNVYLYFSLPEDLTETLEQYHQPLDTRFSKIIAEQKRVAPEIIEEIISDALHYKSSDIHFEPRKTEVLVRFRVDGVLQEAGKIPKEYYESILNHIKVLSRLRIDEHFGAQDGSMSFVKEDRRIDLRTSVVPTIEGEKIVLRVLAAYVQGLLLSDVGLSESNLEQLSIDIKKPFGMILVAGPTGSGKTTTLYALLKLVNNPNVNITTIEDPVEYKLEGINQIQVNQQTNLTFAKGLRSIVRQDPDVVLVGEIRDEETAEIAVNAALTGHLLLSTFHANDASTAITRLLEMNIEPFLLSSTLEKVIAQRLVRKICSHCRVSIEDKSLPPGISQPMFNRYFGEGATLYEGKGCGSCGHTGYNGRTAIFEIIKISQKIQDLILKQPSSSQIWEEAKTEGAKSLFDDGVEKVKAGITTLEELLRVAGTPKTNESKPTQRVKGNE